jgi:hypothetical protein
MVSSVITIFLGLVVSSAAFTNPLALRPAVTLAAPSAVVVFSTTEEAATTEAPSDLADVEIPTNLPSDCGKDYIPLATMLATGDFEQADQVGVCLCFGTLTFGRRRRRRRKHGDQVPI